MKTRKNISAFISHLKKIKNSHEDTLERYVADYTLERYTTHEEIETFFNDLLQHGCVSGMIDTLIYYVDTNAFFDRFYYEIMELKTQYEDCIGQPMELPYHLKNHLAWFGFEETAKRLWEGE